MVFYCITIFKFIFNYIIIYKFITKTNSYRINRI
nr:MAG TPA: hypothetical protein [Caudoviricetes sp.]DAS44980.1 MAG TPA: hypothetical protein [Caudoviricetes sp.]